MPPNIQPGPRPSSTRPRYEFRKTSQTCQLPTRRNRGQFRPSRRCAALIEVAANSAIDSWASPPPDNTHQTRFFAGHREVGDKHAEMDEVRRREGESDVPPIDHQEACRR
jgi:hypothetical protein